MSGNFSKSICAAAILSWSTGCLAQSYTEVAVGQIKGQDLGFSSWCDVNADGYLDILVTGLNLVNGQTDFNNTIIYLNDKSGSFHDSGITNIPRLIYGSCDWGDVNNDGLPDLLISGTTSGYPADGKTKIFLNQGGSLTEMSSGLPGVIGSQTKFLDYNNDGWMDVFVMGFSNTNNFMVKIFKNNSGTSFTNSGITFNYPDGQINNLGSGGTVIADFDNDGDKDLIIGQNSMQGFSVNAFRNDNGNFVLTQSNLAQLSYATLAVADFDGDGILDFVVNGLTFNSTIDDDGGASDFLIFKGGPAMNFTLKKQFANQGTYWGGLAAGDMNQDGLPDIIISGGGNGLIKTRIYLNSGTGDFIETDPGMVNTNLGDLNLGDFDNDGDLDMLVTGENGIGSDHAQARVYRNNSTGNQRPAVPQNLNLVTSSGKTTFSWSKSHDSTTPAKSISYNIKVGTLPKKDDLQSGLSLVDGTRLIEAIGNANLDTAITLALAPGKYYWQVQAIDAAYFESEWSPLQNICTTSVPVADNKSSYCYGDQITITASGNDIKWYSDEGLTLLLQDGASLSVGLTRSDTFYVTQTAGGCASQPLKVQLNVKGPPVANFQSQYCFGDDLVLTADGDGIEWFSDSALKKLVHAGAVYELMSSTDFTLYAAQTEGACAGTPEKVQVHVTSMSSISLSVKGIPVNSDSIVLVRCGNVPWQIEATGNYPEVTWQSTGGPILSVDKDGVYEVISTDGICSSKHEVNVVLVPVDPGKIPNVITPNGDKWNQYFKLDFAGIAPSVSIFDRYGLNVFSSNAYENSFDGGNLSAGVYFYIIRVGACDEEWKGWLSIAR